MRVQLVAMLLLFLSCKKVQENITILEAKSGTIYLESVQDLPLTEGQADVLVYVEDSLRGGTFYFSQEDLAPDSGTVFKAAGGGYWLRSFDKNTGYNVDWFGAKGDGQAFDDSCIQQAMDVAGTGATVYCRSGATYLIRNSIVFKNNQVLLGNNAVVKRAPTVEKHLTAPVHYLETSITLDEVPADWKAGDAIQLYTDSSGDKSASVNGIQAVAGKTITLKLPVGTSVDVTIDNWPSGTMVRKVFTMITAADPNAVSTAASIYRLILDGNKEQNSQNYYWAANSAILLRGIGTKIESCIFRNMPNESITGHGLTVENCQGYNLNGSFVHLSGLMSLTGQIHSFIKDNYTDGSNLIPNAISKHSEAVITTSYSGGYATIVNNRFYNGGESVIGHLNPSTGNPDDGGTSDLIFQNNICNNFRKIVYQIIDPIYFGYSDSARNVLITDNIFSACGVTDWRGYEYFMPWYIGLEVKDNVYSNGTQFLLPAALSE